MTWTSEVLGARFYRGDLDSAATLLLDRALSGKGGYACLTNVHVLMTARRDIELMQALHEAWINFPDGAPVAWMQRRAGMPDSERIAGADLLCRVASLGQSRSLRHYFFGSTAEVVSALQVRLREFAPKISAVGVESPPVVTGADLRQASIERIRAANPHIVWCALGAPKQELWMRQAAAELAPAVLVGVGAAFDFLAGTKPRAPMIMRRSGFEWLHRLYNEPRRLGGRYLSTNADFVVLVGSRWIRHSAVEMFDRFRRASSGRRADGS